MNKMCLKFGLLHPSENFFFSILILLPCIANILSKKKPILNKGEKPYIYTKGPLTTRNLDISAVF